MSHANGQGEASRDVIGRQLSSIHSSTDTCHARGAIPASVFFPPFFGPFLGADAVRIKFFGQIREK